MEPEFDRAKVIARLIANTRRKKRYDNLVEIARQIRWLEDDLGGLTEVSKAIGISTDQIRQFLSVEKLSPKVRRMVEERKIDLINTVHYMRKFDHKAQEEIASEVIRGGLTAGDIRVLAPLRNNPGYNDVRDLISRVRSTKNVKLYVLYFRVPKGLNDSEKLEDVFEDIVGEHGMSSFKIEGQTGILEVTAAGKAKLLEESKKRNVSLRAFIDNIVIEVAR